MGAREARKGGFALLEDVTPAVAPSVGVVLIHSALDGFGILTIPRANGAGMASGQQKGRGH